LGVALEEFLQPLAASLGHDARVPPPAWGTGSGLNEGDGRRVLGEGLGARLDLIVAVTAWFLALHGLALPSLCALVDVMVYEYSGKSQIPPDFVVKFQAIDIARVIEFSWGDEVRPKIVWQQEIKARAALHIQGLLGYH
jgi:hypothetical protein